MWRLPAKSTADDVERHQVVQYFRAEAYKIEEHLLELLRLTTGFAIREVKNEPK